MTDQTEPHEEVWAYGGARVDADGKRQYARLPEAGRIRTRPVLLDRAVNGRVQWRHS
jgi:hypothetical protein